MPAPLILLTHPADGRALYYGERALAALERLGPVRLNETGVPLEGDALVAAAAGIRVIVADRAVPAPAGLFAATPDLVAFVRCAVDVRTVDVAAASSAGVLVTQASPGFAAPVAELIVGLMVDLGRSVSAAVADYRAGVRPAVRLGRQIAGSVVGIVGYGTIGRALAPILQAMGARVLVADPYADQLAPGLEGVDLPGLLSAADTVVVLAPATAATANLIDAAALARMRPGAVLVNAARGELVDEAALEAALASGHLGGAALDVGRAADQMPSPGLARRPDVVATPHIGGLTRQATEHQASETVHQVECILHGRAPPGSLNAASAVRLRSPQRPVRA